MSVYIVVSTPKRLTELIYELAASSLEGGGTVKDTTKGTEIFKYDEYRSKEYWSLGREYFESAVRTISRLRM
jgi:hypothetical protein